MMPIIHGDELGLWVAAGGYVSRPAVAGQTRFKAGDEVRTHHYGGSIRAGVGKGPTCKRGQYLEIWVTTGTSTHERKSWIETDIEEAQKHLTWYREEFRSMYGHLEE